jgi:hypothetical protein
MGEQSSLAILRALAERQGVEPTDEDLQGVLGFLERILPALEGLEELLPEDVTP